MQVYVSSWQFIKDVAKVSETEGLVLMYDVDVRKVHEEKRAMLVRAYILKGEGRTDRGNTDGVDREY